MRGQKFSVGSTLILVVAAMVPTIGTRAAAQAEKVIYNFTVYGTFNGGPSGGLIFDASGNLYGTTFLGGTDNCGRVFELTPQASGGWTEKVLHNFDNNGKDGCEPQGNLIFDSAGSLYGTTNVGGANNDGIVFALKHNASGGWVEQVLHTFNRNGTDGYGPAAGLIFDSAGNLFGTTSLGGTNGAVGTVFELSPGSNGNWTEKALYDFSSTGVNGAYPLENVTFDTAGNIYGTTAHGGTDNNNYGIVFQLTPKSGGGWTENVLYSFSNGPNGDGPWGLVFDAAGNIYGTTTSGGVGSCNFEGIVGCGTVFELSPKAGGGWTETVLYSFQGGNDGQYPRAGLVFDKAGNLYGTTANGGIYQRCNIDNISIGGCGTVFELVPNAGGGWTEKILHSFGNNMDGMIPEAGLIFDAVGNLYGTTFWGGVHGGGTVFKITP